MVNFRLSEDEYQALKNVCIAQGAHSLSEYAREAVYRLVGSSGGSQGGEAESKVQQLNARIDQLDREVKLMAQCLEVLIPRKKWKTIGSSQGVEQ